MSRLPQHGVRAGQVYRDRDKRRPDLVVVESVVRHHADVLRYTRSGPRRALVRLDRLKDKRLFDYVRIQATARDCRP